MAENKKDSFLIIDGESNHQDYPPGFFTSSAGKILGPGTYIITTLLPPDQQNVCLATCKMCDGRSPCHEMVGFQKIRAYQAAVDPTNTEKTRNQMISQILPNQYNVHPLFSTTAECGTLPATLLSNVIHHGYLQRGLLHAWVVGPCSIEEMQSAHRVMMNIGIDRDKIQITFNGDDNTVEEK